MAAWRALASASRAAGAEGALIGVLRSTRTLRSENGGHSNGVPSIISTASGRSAALGIAIVVAALGVLFLLEPPASTRFWNTLFSSGHAPLFGVIALALLAVTRAGMRSPDRGGKAYLIALLAAAALGAATELIQLADPQRQASWADWFRDLAGASAFLLGAATFDKRLPLRNVHRACAVGLSAVLVVAIALPVATLTRSYQHRTAAFPVVLDLRAGWQKPFLALRGTQIGSMPVSEVLPPVSQSEAVSVSFEPGRYPGITVNEPYPDWSNHEYLVLEVYSPQPAPVSLTLRVHDRMHDHRYEDRFNRTFEVRPGHNRFAVALEQIRNAPQERTMDMRQIAGMVLFSHRNTETFTIDLAPIVLL